MKWNRILAVFVAAPLLILCVLLSSPPIQAAASGEARGLATATDVVSYSFINGKCPDFIQSPDGSQMIVVTGQSMDANIYGVPDWTPQDGGTKDYGWEFLSWQDVHFAPDGRKIATTVHREGKTWVGLRERSSPDGEVIYRWPMDLNGGIAYYSNDGKGLFLVVGQELQRKRKQPKDDNPPTEDLNASVLVSKQYRPESTWDRIQKAYPGAIADKSRFYVIYLDLATHESRRVLTGNDMGQLVLSPDQTRIVVTQSVRDSDNPDSPLNEGVHANVYLMDLPVAGGLQPIDLFAVKEQERNAGWFDFQKNRMTPIMTDSGASNIFWTRDGGAFVYIDEGANHTGDVWIYDVAKKQSRNLTAGVNPMDVEPRILEPLAEQLPNPVRRWTNGALCWAPDGRSLLATSRGYLWRIPLDGGAPTNLSTDSGPLGIVGSVVETNKLKNAFSPGPDEVLVVTTDMRTLQDGIARFNLQTGHMDPIVENVGSIGMIRVNTAKQAVYYSAVTPTTPRQIFEQPLAPGASARQLSDFQKELNSKKLPEKMLISYTTKSGRKGWGRLLLPAGGDLGRKWPLVMIHELDSTALSHYDQLSDRTYESLESSLGIWRSEGIQAYSQLAEQFHKAGYAVLYFDIPLSEPGVYEDIRSRVVEAYDAATGAAVATGRVDPRKIAIWGFGRNGFDGYYVLIVLGQRDCYSAAAIDGAFGMLDSQALSEGEYAEELMRKGDGRMGEYYAKAANRYQQMSALPYLSSLRTPLLIMHEQNVPSVLADRMYEIYNAARQTDDKVVAVYYKKYFNRDPPIEDALRRSIFWFNEHLSGGPALADKATLPAMTVDSQP